MCKIHSDPSLQTQPLQSTKLSWSIFVYYPFAVLLTSDLPVECRWRQTAKALQVCGCSQISAGIKVSAVSDDLQYTRGLWHNTSIFFIFSSVNLCPCLIQNFHHIKHLSDLILKFWITLKIQKSLWFCRRTRLCCLILWTPLLHRLFHIKVKEIIEKWIA